ncbi:hypothetical protein [Aurantimonas coralicida]|uniref:hypothetical protein n=1 Tax=Aurantimonas coralicida TaxID=182270 RepID=UPI001D18C2D8|nr:hypothetical protein [Aurantimonas coralicida]MCC4298548.1 hypothetical protein [Aurantimonas coralicida]
MASRASIFLARDWIGAIGDRCCADADDLTLIARALALVQPRAGLIAAAAMLDAARIVGEGGDPAGVLDDTETPLETGEAMIDGFVVVLALTMGAYAFVRRDYSSSQDAAAAREDLLARAGLAYDLAGSRLSDEVFGYVATLVGEAALQLSRTAADRAPLVRVETGISLPSTLLAWQLYGDPARASELVERNKSATPAVMPTAFEAIAP